MRAGQPDPPGRAVHLGVEHLRASLRKHGPRELPEQLERAGVHIIGAVLDGLRNEMPAAIRRYFDPD